MELGVIWQNTNYGSAKRVGHYLDAEVGEGNIFNISTLRENIPGVAQLDRRMRDLRKVGWVIHSYKDMSNLKPDELYLEKVGKKVWEPGFKWPEAGISSGKRRGIFERDGTRCFVCGIEFGSTYPHAPHMTAKGTIGHIIARERGGGDNVENLRPECHLCNEQSRNLTGTPVDVGLLQRKISQLRRSQKEKLRNWMLAEQRHFEEIETLWMEYQQLPAPRKLAVREALSKQL